jgi:hypothetical protein
MRESSATVTRTASGGAVAVGDVIAGRYRLDAEIGSGGMGEVWRATDRETSATVALKRVRLSHLAADERDRARKRLRAEAGILHRSYIDQFGNPYSELMEVEVRQSRPVADPCPQAVAIATVAVERLPAAP